MRAETVASGSGATGGDGAQACLVELPAMLDEIVRGALRAAQIQIVDDPTSLARGSRGDRAAVIITADSSDGALRRFKPLLGETPGIAILAVAGSGREATLLELWPVERTLGELSESLLVTTVATVTPWDQRFLRTGRS
jgi:hypothetical protein